MVRSFNFFLTCLLPVLFLVSCSKADVFIDPSDYRKGDYISYSSPDGQEADQAVGTLRSHDGVRYITLTSNSFAMILNPEMVKDIPDGTRVYVQYRTSPGSLTSFFTEAVTVEWATPLDVGSVSDKVMDTASKTAYGDPVDIVSDWVTSLEDGFITLHYTVESSGNVMHSFTLYKGESPYEFYLRHDAGGDKGGSPTDGIVCFPVEGLLPETEGKTEKVCVNYLNLKKNQEILAFEYCTGK